MVELVDAPHSKCGTARCVGSSPTGGTTLLTSFDQWPKPAGRSVLRSADRTGETVAIRAPNGDRSSHLGAAGECTQLPHNSNSPSHFMIADSVIESQSLGRERLSPSDWVQPDGGKHGRRPMFSATAIPVPPNTSVVRPASRTWNMALFSSEGVGSHPSYLSAWAYETEDHHWRASRSMADWTAHPPVFPLGRSVFRLSPGH